MSVKATSSDRIAWSRGAEASGWVLAALAILGAFYGAVTCVRILTLAGFHAKTYLQDGVWNGERILPGGWVEYSRAPAPAAPGAQYGARFWRELPGSYRAQERPSLPADMYSMVAHAGQFVTIVPSANLVVVRLGWGLERGAWDHEAFVAGISSAAKPGTQQHVSDL